VISHATGATGPVVTARAEVIIAAMEALAHPNVVSHDGEFRSRYSPEEARASFRTLAESMLQRGS
jgi:hypothetical protein